MKAKDLLSQLSRMEHLLHDFSYEELTADEATELQNTFKTFKKNLENKVFQPSASNTFTSSNELSEETGLPKNPDLESNDSSMHIARVSHEIRTPLNGIIGFTELLREDDELNPRQLEQVSAIQKASYSLMEIINELLEYSKLTSGKENFEAIDFNFRNVVGDVVYLCNTLVSEKDVKLNVSIAKNIPDVLFGDPSKLSQVLLNLIGNAIKFVVKGSIDVVVRAKKTKNNGTLLKFTIADTGIGISEENLKHIFESFKQADATTQIKYGGSGLGLTIVKHIIEQLGGNIKVTSELGVGTSFEFSMPYEIGDVKNLVIINDIHFEISEKQIDVVRDMQILIFEDNILNQKLIDQRLKSWGCKTYITDDPEHGLNILSNHKIDLVLMDLKMPGMNGFEITELIRSFEKPGAQSIPIIALSADFSVQDKEKCDTCGIDDFIMKPYSSEVLLQKLIECKENINSSRSNNLDSIDNEVELINLSELLEECMGQLEILEELIGLFKQNALEFIGTVRVHLMNSDSEQIGFSAHKIKSGLKMLQSTSLLDIVEQIQECCHLDGDMKHLQFLYDSFLVEYPKSEDAIDSALDELRNSER